MAGPGPITAYIVKKLDAYNQEKSGNQGKVGNPDTSPAPTQASGINMLEQRPIKEDNLKPNKPIKAMY